MKKKLNENGFALVETLVVALFVVVIFMVIFQNFYPLIGRLNRYDNYDDIDTKYATYYIRNMINSQNNSTRSTIFNKLGSNTIYKFNINDSTNELCELLDNKDFCYYYMEKAKVSNIYLTQYETRNLKEALRNNTIPSQGISRAAELYIDYIPTYSATASSGEKAGYIRIIVEIRHENDDLEQSEKYYYTYSNIELNMNTIDTNKSFRIMNGDTTNYEIGQAIAFDSELFHIIQMNDETVTLLSAYNLNIGSYTNTGVYGLQNIHAGTIEQSITTTNPSGVSSTGTTQTTTNYTIGGIPLTNTISWENSSKYISTTVNSYLNAYKTYLNNYITEVDDFTIRLLTGEEFINLQTNCEAGTCIVPEWLTNKSYWLSTGKQGNNCIDAFKINQSSYECIKNFNKNYLYGIRPVIVLPKSMFN